MDNGNCENDHSFLLSSSPNGVESLVHTNITVWSMRNDVSIFKLIIILPQRKINNHTNTMFYRHICMNGIMLY